MINANIGNWTAWPVCPKCEARRETQCSVCSARGTDFRLADFDEAEDSAEAAEEMDVLLLCSTCDEPFTPRFFRLCAGCGFDHGTGIEKEAELEREELNNRVILVIVSVVLILVGLLAFFGFVLRG
ncbi:MAG: hypothetical protein H6822_21125 [Planctomycetaceae bacterium]|nr:hypothetical protein [Planctomycetales bacterium]MCB9924696.1 hypothetical protein [Planctomycetaceae bacterium]